MIETPSRGTFRDPAGSLALEDDRAVRTIHPAAREAVLRLVRSPFFARLQQRGDIVVTTIDDSSSGLRLLHARVPLPSYPWEWTPSQWLAAANLTLDLCSEALAEGWILKDATPLNILFAGPRPILVDVLSFEPIDYTRRDPPPSIWLAYGQYTRTFLLPLLINRLLAWPLELTLFKRDGYEPTELYRAMNWLQRLSPSAFVPVTLPSWLERRKAASSSQPATARPAAVRSNDPELTSHILSNTLSTLRKRTRNALPRSAASDWADYQGTFTHYTPQQTEQKRLWVRSILEELRPRRVLDIGANTGEYSTLAGSTGAEVIALERDAAAAEQLFASTRTFPIQTIHADFARPTPAAGWQNSESLSLLARLQSPAAQCDLVMMLAVIHHLILMEQIPLPEILALVHSLASRFLIVEWVPVTDPMFQSLMRGRDDLYAALTERDLLAACARRFTLLRQTTLTNGRILFLFETIATRSAPGMPG